MRASAKLLLGVVVVEAVGLAFGCSAILGVDAGKPYPDAGGGGSGTTSSAMSSATAGTTSSATAGTTSSGTGGSTVMPKANGTPCTADAECKSGACVDDGQGGKICCETSCGGHLACGPGGVCPAGCSGDGGCATGYGCGDGGACLAGQGQACMGAADCESGFCTDGVCCNIGCDNAPCYACSATLTGGTDGTCAPATNGTVDPRGLCTPEPKTVCFEDGKCADGLCELWPNGTVCGSTDCNGSVKVQACDGNGTCANSPETVECPALGCAGPNSEACPCNSSTDCPTPFPNCVLPSPPPPGCVPACNAGYTCCHQTCYQGTIPCYLGYCAP